MPETNNILLEIRDRTARIEQRMEDRDRQMAEFSDRQELLSTRTSDLERQYAGLRAWIAAAGLVGGIVGWVAHTLLPSMSGR